MKKKLINQCGPRIFGLYKIIPNWCFGQACNMHDLNYALKITRKEADDYFFKEMLETSIKQKHFKLWYVLMAYLYYVFVRAFGGFFWGNQK